MTLIRMLEKRAEYKRFEEVANEMAAGLSVLELLADDHGDGELMRLVVALREQVGTSGNPALSSNPESAAYAQEMIGVVISKLQVVVAKGLTPIKPIANSMPRTGWGLKVAESLFKDVNEGHPVPDAEAIDLLILNATVPRGSIDEDGPQYQDLCDVVIAYDALGTVIIDFLK